MLANILPGLRDLRTPLAVGFMWLFAVWLVIYPYIPTQEEASGPIAEFYRLFGAFEGAALVAVVTFAAYLVGVVMEPISVLPRMVGHLLFARGMMLPAYRRDYVVLSAPIMADAKSFSSYLASRLVAAPDTPERRKIFRILGYIGDPPPRYEFYETPPPRPQISEHMVLAERILVNMHSTVRVAAGRLQVTKSELFNPYDRATAEASFRYGVIIPLLALAALGMWRFAPYASGWWIYAIYWSLVIGVLFVLLDAAFRKHRDSNDAVYTAVFLEQVQFPIEARIEALEEEPEESVEMLKEEHDTFRERWRKAMRILWETRQ